MCVNKIDRLNPHERILAIGGVDGSGRWKVPQQEAVRHIEINPRAYYVSVNGVSVWVIIGISQYGNKYLRTEADRADENNLLSLPECP
jgi:hypothetical protein